LTGNSHSVQGAVMVIDKCSVSYYIIKKRWRRPSQNMPLSCWRDQ